MSALGFEQHARVAVPREVALVLGRPSHLPLARRAREPMFSAAHSEGFAPGTGHTRPSGGPGDDFAPAGPRSHPWDGALRVRSEAGQT
ncbi:hypothetical protein GCM10009757_40050 [Streptomyces cheonanensis]|uniref:Uncharacterized protein n=1 Tax=Streptomyces cheonanensis TaxID=312720 RepID=A0ABN2VCH4_9ACTN